MAKYADITVKGSVENIQDLVQRAFGYNGFIVRMESGTKGTAERGSKGANVLLGALATHHKVEFEILPAAEGGTLRLVKKGSGVSGGILGMRKANKEFEKLTDILASWFKEQGLLLDLKKV